MNFLRRRRNSDELPEAEPPAASRSRKPPNTAFRQQRLKAWQPILTPKTVIPFLFLLAVIFAPLGIAIVYTTNNVLNLMVDYTHCADLVLESYEKIPSKYTSHHFGGKDAPDYQWKLVNSTDASGAVQTCHIQFNLPKDLKPPLYLYYKLTNFYQNHRKYALLYDIDQLGGHAKKWDLLTSDCKPLRAEGDKAIYPCGLVANSLFNDTFSSPVLLNSRSGSDNETYVMSEKGISWDLDRKHRFKKTKYAAADIVPPPNWRKMFPQGYNDSNIPDLLQWEHLQNWMRTAGLPTFYKLYSKNDTAPLALGTYEVQVRLNYPVLVFGGTKSLVISNNTVLGGRNLLLGIIYIVVAILCVVCAVFFLMQHLIWPRRIGDHNFLQDPNTFRSEPTHVRDQL